MRWTRCASRRLNLCIHRYTLIPLVTFRSLSTHRCRLPHPTLTPTPPHPLPRPPSPSLALPSPLSIMGNVAHDLKTPLHSIMAEVEHLKQTIQDICDSVTDSLPQSPNPHPTTPPAPHGSHGAHSPVALAAGGGAGAGTGAVTGVGAGTESESGAGVGVGSGAGAGTGAGSVGLSVSGKREVSFRGPSAANVRDRC